MNLGPHADFIVAAYAVTAFVVAALVAWVVLDYSAQRRILGDLEERRGRGVFDGSYTWTHYGQRKAPPFPAAFLRRLAKSAWVPDASGDLVRPALVTFESLGWKANPFLLSKIAFKPPIIDQLAKEASREFGFVAMSRFPGLQVIRDGDGRPHIASVRGSCGSGSSPSEALRAGSQGGGSGGRGAATTGGTPTGVQGSGGTGQGSSSIDPPPGTAFCNGIAMRVTQRSGVEVSLTILRPCSG